MMWLVIGWDHCATNMWLNFASWFSEATEQTAQVLHVWIRMADRAGASTF